MGGDSSTVAAELVAVLSEVGVPADVSPAGDVTISSGGLALDVRSAARPTLQRIETWLRERDDSSRVLVVVADQIDPAQREALQAAGAGWLDRSGHLRLFAGSVQIDRPIASLAAPETVPPQPLDRPTGLAVALALLTTPPPSTVRAVATAAGVSVGAAHATLAELAELELLVDGVPRHPDLFWATAARWRVRWFGLDRAPGAWIPEATQHLLRIGSDDPAGAGWAQVGASAAQAYGAPVVADEQPRLYVPDRRALTWTLRTCGAAQDDLQTSAFVAVPATAMATTRRRDQRQADDRAEWFLAHPVVVALELASSTDPRDREILEGWTPKQAGVERVW